jgi:deoxyribose-phosphate aldolase
MRSIELESLIGEAEQATMDADGARQAIGLLDLTSLKGDESEQEIEALCRDAAAFGVAAVCVFPAFLPSAAKHLAGSAVRLAAVANFPDGSDDIMRAVEEARDAVSKGAGEIDLVAPLNAILEGDVGLVGEMVEACRDAVGPGIRIKLILETGLLQSPDKITAAARSAVMAGVDMLKTSTGKIETGATFEAAATLLAVIGESGGRVGLKVSGGVRTADQAAGYLKLVRRMQGDDWIDADHVRIGASSLLADLRKRAGIA